MCHIFFIIFHQNVDSEQNVHRTYHAAMLKCPKTKKIMENGIGLINENKR